MKTHCYHLILFVCGLCTVPTRLYAQHYPAGSEGIKAGSAPAPGLYAMDYNSFYYSDRIPGFYGQFESGRGFSILTYAQAPRLKWITDWHFLGADYGIAFRIPFMYKEVTRRLLSFGLFPTYSAPVTRSRFGLSDIEIEPVILSWHLKRFDVTVGYSVWAPTGAFDKDEFFWLNLGQGCWTHVPAVGATWYPDGAKKWSVSVMNRYEINTEQFRREYVGVGSTPISIGTTLGDIYTLEWGIGRIVNTNVEIGITGYYQQQVTDTKGPSGSWIENYHLAGVGPEISVYFTRLGLATSLRYGYEFSAYERPQGHSITLTLTKHF